MTRDLAVDVVGDGDAERRESVQDRADKVETQSEWFERGEKLHSFQACCDLESLPVRDARLAEQNLTFLHSNFLDKVWFVEVFDLRGSFDEETL